MKSFSDSMCRVKIDIRGAVQGVGFRPFVYRLAQELSLKGWVLNSSIGLQIEAEGSRDRLEELLVRIRKEKPAHAVIQSFEYSFLEGKGYSNFEIRKSDDSKDKITLIQADIATCPECLKEIFDSDNRRHLYPFTNCTHCGPRYSIIESLPYDRKNTTMKSFTMCAGCQKEYDDPANRRFHAQPNGCSVCGPHCELWDEKGEVLSTHDEALRAAVEAIKEGKIVAVKGLGGFHLMVDARSDRSVEKLRRKKHREEKPFALMFPSLAMIKEQCEVAETEDQLLTSSEAPIVLLRKKKGDSLCTRTGQGLSTYCAPGNPYLGVMLPYTPLHHILMKELGFPIVATSGNISDEPICIDKQEALERLKGIADLFLVHNRPIKRHVDDSIVRIIADRPLILRRARGYAPFPILVRNDVNGIVGVGAHLKNAVALGVKDNIFVSQHVGDLETKQSFEAFTKTIEDLGRLFEMKKMTLACDQHPAYLSTQYAQITGGQEEYVQHHHAHIVSCMAENEIDEQVLGLSWDGTGYGEDNTVWGGEFLMATLKGFKRVGHFRTFLLPGGEVAIKEPRRTGLGMLYELLGEEVFKMTNIPTVKAFSEGELDMMQQILEKRLNCPLTSSVGRIFDAVASIIGLGQQINFEGQVAMSLEYALDEVQTKEYYTLDIVEDESLENKDKFYILDWARMLQEILNDWNKKVSAGKISAKFHNALVEGAVSLAKRKWGTDTYIGSPKGACPRYVVLSGGCFQNKYLTERMIERLKEEGFEPVWHQRIPPNDGGIALGQVMVASKRRKKCV